MFAQGKPTESRACFPIVDSQSGRSRRLFLKGLSRGVGALLLGPFDEDDGSALGMWANAAGSTASMANATRNRAGVPSGNVVDASFFGMHFSSAKNKPWPNLKFQILRTWDQWPGVSWMDLNPAKGVYNWNNLDAAVSAATSHGVDIVYTFGYVPGWASSDRSSARGAGSAGSCFSPDITAWRTFVTQITSRYIGKIKYWELWNEPNAKKFWYGTTPQLVAMARVAYSIIKRAGGTVLSPAPQGANAHLWLNDYFAQGGGACTDAVSFHGYLYGPPELIVPLVSNLRTVMLKYGLDGAQLWDTEHSWGDVSWPFGTTQDQRAAWLARYIVLSITSKVTRSIWYMYDSTEWGTLAEQSTERILKPGVAYEQIHKWTLGAVVRECALLADVYQCSLDRPETYQAQIVWNCKTMDGQTARFKPPSGYTQYQTLQGKTVKIALGASVPIGMQPVLIEKLE